MKTIPITLETILRDAALRDGVQRLIVGAVIPDGESVLVLERATDDFMPGILELPSGKVESRESLTAALCREVLEETRLDVIEISDYLGHFDYLSKSGRLSRQFNFVVAVAVGTIQLSEHTDYAWVTESEVAKAWITDSTRNTIAAYMNGKKAN